MVTVVVIVSAVNLTNVSSALSKHVNPISTAQLASIVVEQGVPTSL